MLGAIVGDVVGSTYEWERTKDPGFELRPEASAPTDDSILSIVVAEHLLTGSDLVSRMHEVVEDYPWAGWGGRFRMWAIARERTPYNSFGNGSAMRTSAVGWIDGSLEERLAVARRVAAVTHDHPEGIRGAEATVAAIHWAREGRAPSEIRSLIVTRFGYDLSKSVAEIRPDYEFDETCQRTVPQAITAALESRHFEEAIRNAVSLGGDSDTVAAIAGGIAEALHGGVPPDLRDWALDRVGLVTPDLLPIVHRFVLATPVPWLE